MLGTGTGCLFFCREQALFFCTIAVPKLHIRCTSLSNSTVIAMLYFLLRILFFSSGKTVGEKSVFNNFNALMGLSCYTWFFGNSNAIMSFQCPHGLELLLIVEVKGTARIDVSMPSRAWVVTVKHSDLEGENMFQCPHGLELLRTNFSNHYNSFSGFNALMGLSCYTRHHGQ